MLSFTSGTTSSGSSGSFTVGTGTATNGKGGDMILSIGSGTNFDGGDIHEIWGILQHQQKIVVQYR